MPVPERQYLASQSCGGLSAERRLPDSDPANVAADPLRRWGSTVSGAIALSRDQVGMTPPMKTVLYLRRFEQVGDEVAQAPSFKVRTLMQVLLKHTFDHGGNSRQMVLSVSRRP